MLKTNRYFRLEHVGCATRADSDPEKAIGLTDIPSGLIYNENVDKEDKVLVLSDYDDAKKAYKAVLTAQVLLWIWVALIGYAVSWLVIKVTMLCVIPYVLGCAYFSDYLFRVPDGVLWDAEHNIMCIDNGYISWNAGPRTFLRNSPQ